MGANGGNGTAIRFVTTLRDDYSNLSFDRVSAGTRVSFGHAVPGQGGRLSGIASPTFKTALTF